LTENNTTDFSTLFSGVKENFNSYNQLISQDISASFNNVIQNIKFKQIKKNPDLSLHISQYDQIIKNLQEPKQFLIQEIPIAKNIFNSFLELDNIKTNI
jgi:hypothetical protein